MRSKRAKKRSIEQDSVYKSKIVGRFINKLMLDGKKSIAKSSVYYALAKLSEDKKEAIKLFEDAIKNVMPKILKVPKLYWVMTDQKMFIFSSKINGYCKMIRNNLIE